jgi:hypothetical protein
VVFIIVSLCACSLIMKSIKSIRLSLNKYPVLKSLKSIRLSLNNSVCHITTCSDMVNGSAVCWKDITAGEVSFTVRSENVGTVGSGKQYKQYGLHGFMFKELAE